MVKKTNRVRFDKKLLQMICERDCCCVDFNKLGKCNRDTRIDFICMCENPHQKSFDMMYKKGAFCKSCTNTLRIIKTRKTCSLLYNVVNVSQIAYAKPSYNLKNYTFPCGTTIQVQGYEPFLLDILVKEGYTFNDIKTSRDQVPKIWYTKDNKQHRYFCDVYIPKTKTIYEVKSTWTYKLDMVDIPLKKEACIKGGYNFELYVFNPKGIRQFLD